MSEVKNKGEKFPRLFRLLQACSGYELRRLRVFLESPYFNQRPELLDVLDYLRPFFPNPTVQMPSEQEIFNAAWPNESFEPAKYRHLLSALSKLVEEFWQQQLLQGQRSLQHQLLLQSLSQRGLNQDFDATILEAQTMLLDQPIRGADYLRQRFDLSLLQHDHKVRGDNRSLGAGLQSAIEALDEEYFAHKLRLAAAAINRANVIGESTKLGLFPELIVFVDAAPPTIYEGSLVAVYRLVIRTLTQEKDHPAFESLLQLLAQRQGQMDFASLSECYAFALNYCIRMLNLAEPGFDAKLFELYQLLLLEGFLLEDEKLPVQHFKNFLTLGLRLGHERFIASQLTHLSAQLPDEIGEQAIRFGKAALEFQLGHHRIALRLLQQVEFVDVYFLLDAKSLLLKAWYELGEVEPLLSLIESFKIYLRRSRKISDYQRQTYGNLVKIVQMLVRHRLGSRKPMAAIKSSLDTLRPIADLHWLQRKVQEAEN